VQFLKDGRKFPVADAWLGGAMNPVSIPQEGTDSRHWIAEGGIGILRLSWNAIRIPTLALLVVMEPIVCGLLSAVAALGVIVSLIFAFLVKLPHYPFWLMMGISASLAALQIPYYLLIRFLSR
jgi:hypothetical protein